MFTVVEGSRCYDRIEEFGERDEFGHPRYGSGKKADRCSVEDARFTDKGRPLPSKAPVPPSKVTAAKNVGAGVK